MKRRPPRTLLELCVARVGLRKGTRVCTYIVQWHMAQAALGHAPTIKEVGEWWRDTPRTIHRYNAEFREVFPNFDNPQPVVDWLNAHAPDWGRAGVAGIPAIAA